MDNVESAVIIRAPTRDNGLVTRKSAKMRETISVEIPVKDNIRTLLSCLKTNIEISLVNRCRVKNMSLIL